jgi:hypothetical protein
MAYDANEPRFLTSLKAIRDNFAALSASIALKITANSPITGATKTKVTYDANGLITGGTDATTADIADSTDKRYQTDLQQSRNDATSSIQTQINSKQATLVSATNIKTVNGNSLLGSGDLIVNSIPQNSQSADYTTVLADANSHIYHPSADTTDRTFTIDSNANVAYPIGTAITFVNDSSAGVITIAITTDTLVLQSAGTTGSRTLAANGNATALKVTSTRWVISGVNLT